MITPGQLSIDVSKIKVGILQDSAFPLRAVLVRAVENVPSYLRKKLAGGNQFCSEDRPHSMIRTWPNSTMERSGPRS